MSPIQASCPACGAPVLFKTGSSLVVICEFCNSVIARGDRSLEDLGKVVDLVETGSPLDIGLRGVYRGVPFELTGRAQLGHQSGGIWDEWYAAFQDGRWGWLAEAQGRFYMTFQVPLSGQTLIEPFEMLELGEPVRALSSSVSLVVAEKGIAKALGAKGEIPYRLVPGEQHRYADLSGAKGEFGTIDYSENPPLVFVGREAAFADLGFPAGVRAPEREARMVAGVQLSCPQCAGPLELRAPDQTERVTCPNCGSLLDVNQGRLNFLKALGPKIIKPILPLGSVGELGGGQLTVIGFMQRSVEFEGVRYYWEEYLLYNPQVGFRWLVRSDDNWSYVETLPAGAVTIEGNRAARFNGQRYKLYQDANVKVEYVLGEFYWKVSPGEQARAMDFIRPPYMLSKEETYASTQAGERGRRAGAGEINWSLGVYMKHEDVERAFGTAGLPRTSKIAPNQPYLHKNIYKYWLLLLLVTLVFGGYVLSSGANKRVFEQTYQLEPLKSLDDSQIRFSEPFELKARQNVLISAMSNVDNSWMEVQGDLINQATDESQGFSLPVEYYHGVEDGESWSEGGQSGSAHLSALPQGSYILGLDVRWEKFQQPATLTVRVMQGVPNALYLVLALIAVSIFPLVMLFYHYSFERRRWEDSDYSPYRSSE